MSHNQVVFTIVKTVVIVEAVVISNNNNNIIIIGMTSISVSYKNRKTRVQIPSTHLRDTRDGTHLSSLAEQQRQADLWSSLASHAISELHVQ